MVSVGERPSLLSADYFGDRKYRKYHLEDDILSRRLAKVVDGPEDEDAVHLAVTASSDSYQSAGGDKR